MNKLEKVDLSAIKAIAHDGAALQVLIERSGSFQIEQIPAPEQAFQGIQQLARFAVLTQQLDDGARERLLDEIEMIPVG